MIGGTEPAATRRVVLVGNSVSMAPAPGVAPYPDRLAALVGGCWHITPIIRSGWTVEEMEPEVLEALRARPDALVLQTGINDCAPRPLGVAGRARLARLQPQWLRDRIIGVIHRFRPQIIRLRPLAQFTSVERFGSSASRIVHAAREAGAAVLLLPITDVTAIAEVRTPFTNREVARYNGALRSAGRDGGVWIETPALFPGMTPDQYCHAPETVHWSDAAHQRAAEHIAGWLESLT